MVPVPRVELHHVASEEARTAVEVYAVGWTLLVGRPLQLDWPHHSFTWLAFRVPAVAALEDVRMDASTWPAVS